MPSLDSLCSSVLCCSRSSRALPALCEVPGAKHPLIPSDTNLSQRASGSAHLYPNPEGCCKQPLGNERKKTAVTPSHLPPRHAAPARCAPRVEALREPRLVSSTAEQQYRIQKGEGTSFSQITQTNTFCCCSCPRLQHPARSRPAKPYSELCSPAPALGSVCWSYREFYILINPKIHR